MYVCMYVCMQVTVLSVIFPLHGLRLDEHEDMMDWDSLQEPL